MLKSVVICHLVERIVFIRGSIAFFGTFYAFIFENCVKGKVNAVKSTQ